MSFSALREALFFMNMKELREICKELDMPFRGVKQVLIQRIVHFLQTGEVVEELPFPEASRAQKGKAYPFHRDTLILYGNYKNDAATRAFMKTLVGSHFHFTAFGIDWIKEHWREGNPPTYQEFADFWQEQRKQKKPSPKEEWAYINFAQGYLLEKPNASHKEVIGAWKEERLGQVKKAREMIAQECLKRVP